MDYEAGVKDALQEVQGKGKDGNEHLVILRDGQVVHREDGDDHHVNFKGADVRKGDIIVHNHPNSLNSLSNVDTMQLFARDLGAIYAITADGSVYKSTAGSAVVTPRKFMSEWDMAANEFMKPTIMLSVANVPRQTKDRINEAHWINRMLAAKGKINYQFELGPDTKMIVDEFDQRMHFDEVKDEYVKTNFVDAFELLQELLEAMKAVEMAKGE